MGEIYFEGLHGRSSLRVEFHPMRRGAAVLCCLLHLLPLMGLVRLVLPRHNTFVAVPWDSQIVASQAHRTKKLAQFDELLFAQTAQLGAWPAQDVCEGRDYNKPPKPDEVCCVQSGETVIVVTSTSSSLCADGVNPVTIVYASHPAHRTLSRPFAVRDTCHTTYCHTTYRIHRAGTRRRSVPKRTRSRTSRSSAT